MVIAGELRKAKQAREKKVRETNGWSLKVSPILEVLCEASIHSTRSPPSRWQALHLFHAAFDFAAALDFEFAIGHIASDLAA